MATGLEPLIIGKIVMALKGAGVAAAHKGVLVTLANQFAGIAHASGLLVGLKWLVGSLAAIGGLAGVMAALDKLIAAIESDSGTQVVMALADAVRAALGLRN